MLKLEDKMPFGKHKGETCRSLATYHYNYVLWCAKNLNGVQFSDGVMYIAKAEKRQAEGRELAYAYMLPCSKRYNDWSKITDTYQPKNNQIKSVAIQDPSYDDDEESDTWSTRDCDEWGGMSHSDFGNN